jgi:hypothetical protein
MGVTAFQSNKFVRKLRTYRDFGLRIGKPEPIIPGGVTMDMRDAIDTMSGPRLHILMTAIFWEETGLLPPEVLEECANLFFADPYGNGKVVKTATSVIKQMVFARASKGVLGKWSPIREKTDHLEGFHLGRIEEDGHLEKGQYMPFNDAAYYTVFSSQAREGLETMEMAGFKHLAAMYRDLLSPGLEVTEQKLASMALLNTIAGMIGFSRSDPVLSYKDQIKMTWTTPANPGYIPEINKVVDDFVDWAVDNNKFPTDAEFHSRMHTALNSNSAGGPKAKYVLNFQGEREFTAGDKQLVFMSDPWKYISKAAFDESMTPANPANVAGRDVVDMKNTRAVWMFGLTPYLYETAWGYAKLDYLLQTEWAAFGEVGLEAHKVYMYNTSVWYKINVMKDFKNFDVTQGFTNAIGPMAKAMVGAMNRHHLIGQIGELGSLPQAYLSVAHKIRDAVYNVGDGTLVNPQQRPSGHLDTANDNTFINMAEDNYEERVINERYKQLRELIGNRDHYSALGDDSEKDYLVSRSPGPGDIDDWTSAIETAAKECGLFINKPKSVVRTSYHEFLKVLAIYGRLIPQLARLMMFSSERTNNLVDPIESLRGVASFLRTVVARGGPHEWCLKYMHHVWNIKRGVKGNFFKNTAAKEKVSAALAKENKVLERFVDYPFAAIWVPQSLKGVGELPFTLLGASKDAMIYLWAKEYPGMAEVINDAAHALDQPGGDIEREMAMDLEKSGQMDKYRDWLKQYTMNAGRNLAMKVERDKYPSIVLGDLDYEYAPRRRIVKVLKGNAKINSLARERKRFQANRLEERMKVVRATDYLKVNFGWLDSITVRHLEELPDIQEGVAVLVRDESLQRFERKIGFSTVSNDQKVILQKVFRILNDNVFNAESELSFDTLMQLFTRPDIFPNPELIASVAVRIGADPQRAVQFAETFVKSFDSALIYDRGKPGSSGDEFGVTLNLSYSNLLKMIDVPEWILQTDVKYLMHQIGTMMLITTPINRPITKKQIATFGNAQEDIMAHLSPKLNSPIKGYMSGMPLNTFY